MKGIDLSCREIFLDSFFLFHYDIDIPKVCCGGKRQNLILISGWKFRLTACESRHIAEEFRKCMKSTI